MFSFFPKVVILKTFVNWRDQSVFIVLRHGQFHFHSSMHQGSNSNYENLDILWHSNIFRNSFTFILSCLMQWNKNSCRGNFYMVLHGDNSSSTLLRLNTVEAYFEAGRVYHFMAISHDLGHVHSADLVWQYYSHPMNPLTWRIGTESVMYVNR